MQTNYFLHRIFLSCQHYILYFLDNIPENPPADRAGFPPADWKGWPKGKRFAFILTHDVDSIIGYNRCRGLMELEKSIGFRSSFNFVPKRYSVSEALLKELDKNGFEVGVHGLYHDGKLYNNRAIFQERVIQINHYIREWKAAGFRSPSMHHNLLWLNELDIEYDASTFDIDPFEPQSDGVHTIFPFLVEENSGSGGYVELPYTLAQDFTLFILMHEKNDAVWRKKVDWIAEKGGMALLNVHPDYIGFDENQLGLEEYTSRYYKTFLEYVKNQYHDQYWHVLPKELARFWKYER